MKHMLLTLMLASPGLAAYADGTIAFANGTLTRMQWYQSGGSTVPVPTTPGLVVYGVFWGTNRDELTLALPLGSNSTSVAGVITAPFVYSIPGTFGGQTVYLQIKGWSAAYGTNWSAARNDFAAYGETQIIQVILGPEAGPPAVIWGTSPNRFAPLVLGFPLTPPAYVSIGIPPNYSVVVDEGNQGTVDAVLTVIRRSMTLPSPSNLNYTTTVWLSTTNLTALAGQDYVATNVLVTFGPGEIAKPVRITVTGDALPEPDEQFGVKLSSAGSFAALASDVFLVTIRAAQVDSVRIEAGRATVSFRTTGSQRYALESSPDMTSWSAVSGADNIAGTGGIVQVTDPVEACCGTRFYRTRLLP